MKDQRVKGSTSVILEIFIQDNSVTTGAGLTGLVHNSAGLTCYYHRNTAAAAVAVTLADMTVGTFTSSGFKAVDGTNMPGVYQLCIPDAAFATGADSVSVLLKGATNMAPVVLEIRLTGVDWTDAVRAGMTALPNAAAAASGGLFVRGTGAGAINQDANGRIDVNIAAISGDTTSADNLESYTDGTTPIPANMTQIGGGTQSATDLKDFADDGYDPSTNKVQGVVLTDTLTTYTNNTPQTGDSFARLGAPAGASIAADLVVIDNFVDDLESRIGTPSNLGGGATIAANLADIEAQTADIGTAGAGLTAVPWNAAWDAEVQSEVQDAIEANNLDHLVKIAVDTNFATTVHLDSVVGQMVDNGTTATFDRTTDSLEALQAEHDATQTAVDNVDNFLDTEIAAIKAVTDAIGATGSGLSAIPWNAAWDAEVQSEATDALNAYDPPTNAEMEARTLAAASYATAAAIAALNNLSAAQVKTQISDVMRVDTRTLPGQGAPTATPTYEQMMLYLYKAWRNLFTQTSDTYKLYNDAGDTVDQKATVSDDGTVFTRTEITSGP
jgi:hypothetical protein